MFIIVVVEGGVVILEYIILKGGFYIGVFKEVASRCMSI